jgi:hypothetical protein
MLHWQLFSVVIPTYILFLIALGAKGVGAHVALRYYLQRPELVRRIAAQKKV